MEKIKKISGILGLILCFSGFTGAQNKQGIHKGMILAQATLAYGLGVEKGNPESRFYILGESEYLLTDHLGINGSVFANLGSSRDFFAPESEGDLYIHSLFFGPNYHFVAGKPMDFYTGFQPGLSYLRGQPSELGISPGIRGLAPSASLNLGAAWYGSIFHFYTEIRGTGGLFVNRDYKIPLRELRICFGLGFNLF